MTVSLIITTYNWEEALEVCLRSAFRQTWPVEEIIVADDGSRPTTRDLVKCMQTQSPAPLIHVWHEDRGFRAAAIRNKAIAAARGDYVILVDGDIVLERHFVEDHCEAAEPGYFVQGGRVIIGARRTTRILRSGQTHLHPLSWGIFNRKNTIRSKLLSGLTFRSAPSFKGIRTCNFAFWRTDGITVNGFNEAFVGWGREDSEFATRLLNSGVHRRNLRYRALAYHLYHRENSREFLGQNIELLTRTQRLGLKRCKKGVDQYLAQESNLNPEEKKARFSA